MNRLRALHDAGVSIWLDTLSRELLDSGEFDRLIAESAVTGATSNPTISPARYEQVIDAYISGIERRLTARAPVRAVASVASIFVSRIDSKADALLPADSELRGRVALANARCACQRYRERVEELIARDVVNTMPEATLRAFADDGDATRTFTDDIEEDAKTLDRARRAGIDLAAVSDELEREGVRAFCVSYRDLLDRLASAMPPALERTA